MSKTPVIFFLGFVLLAFLMMSVRKVPLDKIGVKVNSLGEGTVQKDLAPGYYFIMPGTQKLYLYDPTIQTFNMGGSDSAQPALQLVGKDQYLTQFDITVVFRIPEGQAHKVADRIGPDMQKMLDVVRSKAELALWDALGRLNTQEFYDVDKRESARATANAKLQESLTEVHLELVDILFRAITYDPNLEKILVQKQLFDQKRALNVEKTKLEAELEKTQSIERETEVLTRVIEEKRIQEIANIEARTDAQINQIEADAAFEAEKLIALAEQYRRTKISEGELARTRAKAKGEKAINEAYLGTGGQAYITRLMIDSMEFGEIEVNTNQMNPFDVNQLLGMLGLDVEKFEAEAALKK